MRLRIQRRRRVTMSPLDRRQVLRGLAGAGALALIDPAVASANRDLIRDENKQPGTTDWQLTYTRVDPKAKYRSTLIEGFASRASVRPGESIDFFVSTDPASRFTIDLYRLGYYQGKGGRHLKRLGPLEGKKQETPAVGEERLRE